MNTDTITDTDFITTIDFGQKLEKLIAAGHYDWTNPRITRENFQIERACTKKFRNMLFPLRDYISSKGALAIIEGKKFTPATHVHGLAFGATFPEEQLKCPIVCLGSSASVGGSRRVLCLYGYETSRCLRLYDYNGDWGGSWSFLGVQEVSRRLK